MRTLRDLHARNARLTPDRTALVYGDHRENYAEYFARALQLGSAIERAGLARQQVVGIFAANSHTYYEVFGACDCSGFICATFNFRLAAPELERLLQRSEAEILFFDADLHEVVERARHVAPRLRFVCIGDEVPDWAIGYEAFLRSGLADGTSFVPRPDDIATLFFTSGSTGQPKGVPWRQDGLIEMARRVAREEETSLLQLSPAFHVAGRGTPLGATWTAGKVVLQRNFQPLEWLQTVERERINITFMVPMMMQAVLDHPRFEDYDISSLAWVMAASTAIPTALLTRALEKFGPVFYVAYGSTEGGGITRMRRAETRPGGSPEQVARMASVGQAEPEVELVILDDDGHPLPNGAIGEVCINAHGFIGYWRDPEASAQAMHGPWFRTGDVGRLDERDYLFLLDRKKDMIISGGENIYSREVEEALHRHADVEAAAVIGVPDEKWGERVLAVVVRRPGATIDEAGLVAFSKTQIANFKCPKRIAFVDALPLINNKPDKLELRRRYADGGP